MRSFLSDGVAHAAKSQEFAGRTAGSVDAAHPAGSCPGAPASRQGLGRTLLQDLHLGIGSLGTDDLYSGLCFDRFVCRTVLTPLFGRRTPVVAVSDRSHWDRFTICRTTHVEALLALPRLGQSHRSAQGCNGLARPV